jgi:DNA-binding beta-propeller fold protein YncE
MSSITIVCSRGFKLMHRRKIQFSLLIGYIALAVLLAACGSSTPATNSATPTLSSHAISSVTMATLGGNYHNPLDSTPDLNGKMIYFTATGAHGQGVFEVPASGGTATEVFTGSPFVSPRSIEVSFDGQKLFVTDPSAGNGGAIFELAIHGDPPKMVPGSEGTDPQNLNLVKQNGQEMMYFTGKDPTSGQAAVLSLPMHGGAQVSVLMKGGPLSSPDGLVVSSSGTIYVSDRSAAGGGMGQIFAIQGNQIKTIVDKIRTGKPAGISCSADGSTLLVSAYQTNSDADQVLIVDPNTLQTASYTNVVGANHSAGGLHESHNAKGVYSWADLTAGSSGRGSVYLVQ